MLILLLRIQTAYCLNTIVYFILIFSLGKFIKFMFFGIIPYKWSWNYNPPLPQRHVQTHWLIYAAIKSIFILCTRCHRSHSVSRFPVFLEHRHVPWNITETFPAPETLSLLVSTRHLDTTRSRLSINTTAAAYSAISPSIGIVGSECMFFYSSVKLKSDRNLNLHL